MSGYRNAGIALSLLLLAGVASAQGSTRDLLPYVPQGTEAVVGIDVVTLSADPVFRELYDKADTTRMDAGIAAIDALTGVDFWRDIRAMLLAGEVGEAGQKAMLLTGSWDRVALQALVAANPSHVVREFQGRSLHSWRDDGSGTRRYASFINDGVLVISEWEAMVESVLEAAAGATPSMAGRPTPAAPLFLVAGRPEAAANLLTDNPVFKELSDLSLGLGFEPGTAVVTGRARAVQAEKAPFIAALVQGLIAYAQVQDNRAHESPWSMSVVNEGAWVNARVAIPAINALGLIAGKD